MMIKHYSFLLFAFFYHTLAYAHQDCCLAQALTGSSPVTIPGNSGNGTSETLSSCSCLSTNEHHSCWFSFVCQQAGTFEMMTNPANFESGFPPSAILPISDNFIQTATWLPEGVANGCGFCLSHVVSPFETTTYTVIVKDINGCSASDGLTVFVDRRRPVFVPNAFSPDGDGINDLLTVFGGQSVARVKRFLVLSRWGETVFQYFDFQPNDPADGWNGTHRGKDLNSDVFTWFAEIEFIDGKTSIFEGDVMLIK